jgi:hypothetical protein
MNRRTFIGAFAWVWAQTRSGIEMNISAAVASFVG